MHFHLWVNKVRLSLAIVNMSFFSVYLHVAKNHCILSLYQTCYVFLKVVRVKNLDVRRTLLEMLNDEFGS